MPSDDRGAAALELSLFLALLFALLTLVAPLGVVLREQLRLQRAANDAARFATTAYDAPQQDATGRRPSADEIRAEAARALAGQGTEPPAGWQDSNVQLSPEPPLAPQATMRVTLSEDVDLGAFGWLLDMTGLVPGHHVHISATATSVEE